MSSRTKNKKGISDVIAIIILLLIAVAISGEAFVYISTYTTGLTKKAVQVTGATCDSTSVTIYFKNIGTETISTGTAAQIGTSNSDFDVLAFDEIGGVTGAPVPAGCSFGAGTFVGVSCLIEGSATSTVSANPLSSSVVPNSIITFKDTSFTSTDDAGAQCRYTIAVGGSAQTVSANC